jgi:hypothetical protein
MFVIETQRVFWEVGIDFKCYLGEFRASEYYKAAEELSVSLVWSRHHGLSLFSLLLPYDIAAARA